MLQRILSFIVLTLALSGQAHADENNPMVLMQTNLGEIKLELFPEQAPETVKNFLSYVDNGFYEGTIFHRTIAGFMIQGGGFDQQMQRKETAAPIQNESTNGLSNLQGTISMARTRDPHSATSQFFINAVNNRNLDATGGRFGYAVFGRVTDGLQLVLKISRTPTEAQAGHRDVPRKPVIIQKISRIPAP
ncbi:peptidylprolyl isomerase [Neptuniibacter halophilus]|uniref:peptidylprolyl isomerase n=1 Tax=Neptuniibacter halophilus TaxID=651666 RepID=UPI0025748067|nr:peptidylprolyl isomerase [Neptuniibacter halophilus]